MFRDQRPGFRVELHLPEDEVVDRQQQFGLPPDGRVQGVDRDIRLVRDLGDRGLPVPERREQAERRFEDQSPGHRCLLLTAYRSVGPALDWLVHAN